MRYFTPTIVALDVDGIINPSPLARIACSKYVSRLLKQMPLFKKLVLGAIEFGETLIKARYEINDRMEIVYRNWDIPYMGIITDRSLKGLTLALKENTFILKRMSFIQVRKTVFGSDGQLKRMNIWETESIKPNEAVLYKLADFAKEKGVKHDEVLLIDDDPEFRLVAKSRFGFTVYPDDTEDVKVDKICPIFMQHIIAPT